MLNIKQNFKRILFNFKNKDNVKLHTNVIFNLNTSFEGNNIVYANSQINDSDIGYGTYISTDCKIPNSIIGRFCCIGSNVKIIFGQHPVTGFVSIHPAFYSTRMPAGFTYVDETKFKEHRFSNDATKKTICIGNDVWIGQDVRILEGVKIADGTIIGAGAIVTKDTEPFSINVGVPAKRIRYRFNESQRDLLNSIKWWDCNPAWIEKHKNLFEDVDLFYESFNNIKNSSE